MVAAMQHYSDMALVLDYSIYKHVFCLLSISIYESAILGIPQALHCHSYSYQYQSPYYYYYYSIMQIIFQRRNRTAGNTAVR